MGAVAERNPLPRRTLHQQYPLENPHLRLQNLVEVVMRVLVERDPRLGMVVVGRDENLVVPLVRRRPRRVRATLHRRE